jgi:hypothetical protein
MRQCGTFIRRADEDDIAMLSSFNCDFLHVQPLGWRCLRFTSRLRATRKLYCRKILQSTKLQTVWQSAVYAVHVWLKGPFL